MVMRLSVLCTPYFIISFMCRRGRGTRTLANNTYESAHLSWPVAELHQFSRGVLLHHEIE